MNSVDWGRCTGEWQGEDGEEGILEPAQLPCSLALIWTRYWDSVIPLK